MDVVPSLAHMGILKRECTTAPGGRDSARGARSGDADLALHSEFGCSGASASSSVSP